MQATVRTCLSAEAVITRKPIVRSMHTVAAMTTSTSNETAEAKFLQQSCSSIVVTAVIVCKHACSSHKIHAAALAYIMQLRIMQQQVHHAVLQTLSKSCNSSTLKLTAAITFMQPQ